MAELEALEQEDGAGVPCERPCSGDADDPGADYDDVGVAGHRCDPSPRSASRARLRRT